MTQLDSPLLPEEHELLVALRNENSGLRERLRDAATALHEMQAELRRTTEENARLVRADESLRSSHAALESQLKTQAAKAEVEIARLRAERRKLEDSLRSYQAETKQRAQVLLRERMVALSETASVRTRLEAALERERKALDRALSEVRLLRRKLEAEASLSSSVGEAAETTGLAARKA